MAYTKLPVTLDWYRDTFKWFVALASGILGFSVTLVKDHPIESSVTKVSFFLVCFLFGVSALFGVWAYLWAVKFGNSRENEEIYKGKIKNESDPGKLEKLQEKLKGTKDDGETAHDHIGGKYTVMIYAFLLGVPAFAVLAWSLLLSKKTAAVAPERQTIQVSMLLGEVGPFAPGSSALPEACNEREDISRVLSQINRRSKDLDYILLVGSADHRKVRTGASNRTLAIMRALWIEHCLREQLPPPLNSLVMTHSVNGPLNLNTWKEELLAEDRRVDVYAVVRNSYLPTIQP